MAKDTSDLCADVGDDVIPSVVHGLLPIVHPHYGRLARGSGCFTMILARETVDAVLEEIKPLLSKHWEEIAHFKDIALDPDYDAYLRAEGANRLRVFTARDDGALIGYGVFFVGSLHYKSSRIATQDILFMSPEHRGFGGFRLVRFCTEQLLGEGMQVVYQHVKLKRGQDFSPLLIKDGYEPIETIFARHHHGRNTGGI